jgi:hypothetical protein
VIESGVAGIFNQVYTQAGICSCHRNQGGEEADSPPTDIYMTRLCVVEDSNNNGRSFSGNGSSSALHTPLHHHHSFHYGFHRGCRNSASLVDGLLYG